MVHSCSWASAGFNRIGKYFHCLFGVLDFGHVEMVDMAFGEFRFTHETFNFQILVQFPLSKVIHGPQCLSVWIFASVL